MSSQVRQALSSVPAFDSGYESRGESSQNVPEDSREAAKKAREKAGELQRRDKMAHYMGALREALPTTMRPGFKGAGYAGGRLAVIETALRYALQLNIDVECLEGKPIDGVTSEVMSILAALSGDSENEAVSGTRERKRKVREMLLVKKFREVLHLMDESGNTYPKWMVLNHAAIYIKQLEQRKKHLEGMQMASTSSVIAPIVPPYRSEATGEGGSAQAQGGWVEQESRDEDLLGSDILPEEWQSLSDRMALSRQPWMQENSLKIHIEKPGPRNRGRRYPRIEKRKRRPARIPRPSSPSEDLLNSLKGLFRSNMDIQTESAGPAIVESINQPPSQPVHGFRTDSRMPEKNREHQSHERFDTPFETGPPDGESPDHAHSRAETIRKLPPIISILNHEDASAGDGEESSQLPPISPGWGREIPTHHRDSADRGPMPFIDQSLRQDWGIKGHVRVGSTISHQPYPMPYRQRGKSSVIGTPCSDVHPTLGWPSIASGSKSKDNSSEKRGDPLRLPHMSSVWDEATVAVYGEWPVTSEQKDISLNRRESYRR